MTMDISSLCVLRRSPISAPMCRPSVPVSPARFTAHCLRASTARPPLRCNRLAFSPIPCQPTSRLGVPLSTIAIIEGDTDQVPFGSGTFGSRSIAVGGSALDCAATKVIEKGKHIAAHLLEASVEDITFDGGEFSIAGTDRRVTLREVAGVAHVPTNYPSGLELGLQDSAVYDPPGFAWSNGAHA